jgi:multidrug resistance efflux pump
MNAKRLIILLLVLAVAGAAYLYANREPSELVLTGIVTTDSVMVSAQIGGKIDRLLVVEGDEVKKDQLLAVIQPAELQAESAYATHNVEGLESQVREAEAQLRYQERQITEQIRQAESKLASTEAQAAAAAADLENARLTYDRMNQLAQNGITAKQQLDEARTARDAAQARVDALKKQVDADRAAVALARANAEQTAVRRSQLQANEHLKAAANAQRQKADVRLGYSEVKAPLDGIVDVRAARQGEVVNAGQPIVALINPDDLWVRADVEETYIDRVRIGDHMTVRWPSGTTSDCAVSYRAVNASYATQRDVSRTKRDIKTFEIRLKCDNTDRRMAVGMTAYVLLPVR